jgi:hypothetical protein
LTYRRCRRSCSEMDAVIISSLPPMFDRSLQPVGLLCSTDITLLPRSYEPLRHPLVFSSFPRELVIEPIFLQRFLPGTRRASPVASSVLAPVLSLSPRRSGQASQPCFTCPCGLRPTVRDSTSEVPYFRGYHCVHFRYGPGTRSPSLRWLCRWASASRFLSTLPSKLQGTGSYPGGLASH